MLRLADTKIKVHFEDLKAFGLVKSRYDLHMKIKDGRLPRPHKDGEAAQSAAWWYAAEIDEAVENERRNLT